MSDSFEIPPLWNAPQPLIERLAGKLVKQRALAEGHDLFVVLHDPPDGGSPDRQSVLYFRNSKKQWKWSPEGDSNKPEALFDRYEDQVEWLGRLMDEANSSEQYFTVYMKVLPIGIALRNAHNALQSAVDQVPRQADLIDLRDRAQVLEREAEILMNETKAGLEFLNAKKAEQQAELSLQMALQQQRLNWLVALFVPLTLVGSMLGMNIPSGLEDKPPSFFWEVVAAGVGIGLVLLLFINAGLKINPGKILKQVTLTPVHLVQQIEKLSPHHLIAKPFGKKPETRNPKQE